ncbi:MAG: hypothetical protein UF438_00890 [Oribacterium sp.]|nr:hypothetical protein [Oribacterium sp.]
MPLWLACVILLLAVLGMMLARRHMSADRHVRILCISFCTILALIALVYIGLTLLLVSAVD